MQAALDPPPAIQPPARTRLEAVLTLIRLAIVLALVAGVVMMVAAAFAPQLAAPRAMAPQLDCSIVDARPSDAAVVAQALPSFPASCAIDRMPVESAQPVTAPNVKEEKRRSAVSRAPSGVPRNGAAVNRSVAAPPVKRSVPRADKKPPKPPSSTAQILAYSRKFPSPFDDRHGQ